MVRSPVSVVFMLGGNDSIVPCSVLGLMFIAFDDANSRTSVESLTSMKMSRCGIESDDRCQEVGYSQSFDMLLPFHQLILLFLYSVEYPFCSSRIVREFTAVFFYSFFLYIAELLRLKLENDTSKHR